LEKLQRLTPPNLSSYLDNNPHEEKPIDLEIRAKECDLEKVVKNSRGTSWLSFG